MRASTIANTIQRAIDGAHPDAAIPGEVIWLRDLARCLAATQAAVEELARDAGSGPARRIKEILDGKEEGEK